jgi:hypothetical protein
VRERFKATRDKLERVKNEVVILATDQLIPRSSSGYADFKEEEEEEKKEKRGRKR